MFKNNNYLSNLAFSVGSALVFFLFSIFLFTLVGFVFNIVIGWYIFVFSIFITICYLLLINKYIFGKDYKKNYFVSLFILIVVFLGSYFISAIFSDLSFDGQSYHQEAIIQLNSGWNPIKNSITPDVWDHTYAIWLNHFPKFSWITWAVISKTFNDIESGKLVNIILAFSCFSFTYAILSYKNKKYFLAFLISILVSFNPIFICQFSSYYLDNQIASMLTIFIFLLFFAFKNDSLFTSVFISIITVLLINLKLTAIAYLPIIYLVALGISFFLKKYNILRRIFVVGLVSGMVSVFVFGFHPFVTTFIEYKNPFYPMYTFYPIKNTSEIHKLGTVIPALPHVTNIREFMYDSNMPKNFVGKMPVEKIFLSLFSESSNLVPYIEDGKEIKNDTTRLKIPFSVEKNEILPFNTADVRIAGFGPWFGGVLILSFALLLVVFFKNFRLGFVLLLVHIGLFGSAFLNTELWWARYVPQLWLVPISVIVLSIFILKDKFLNRFALVSILLLFVNLVFVSYKSIRYQYFESVYRHKYFENIKIQYDLSKKPIEVDFNSFRANRVLYKQLGISYLETAIEIGSLENHIFKQISNDEKSYLLKYYKKDMSTYRYKLDTTTLDELEKDKISTITNSADKRFIID